MIRDFLIKKLQEITGAETVHVNFSDSLDHGDYTTNAAMQISGEMAEKMGSNPRERAQYIIDRFEKDTEVKDVFSKIEVAGPGFINFNLKEEFVSNSVMDILRLGKEFGNSSFKEGSTAVVEYSSPNIAKPFTVGHLRSTIIGDAVSNLLEAIGYDVKRDNHLGDWGTQFGKQIFALKYIDLETGAVNTSGEPYLENNLKRIESSDDPVKLLVNLYVMFHQVSEKNPAYVDIARNEFWELENGNKESRMLWQKCIDWSWREFSKIYEELNITFTENEGKGYGESFFEDKMPLVVSELKEKNLLKFGEGGAQLVFFENNKYPPLMVIKKDGTTLYATRDLATDRFRLDKYGSDVLIINEVGAEQTLYFEQIFELEKKLGWVKNGQRVHIKHGLFRFNDKKMSTRKGDVIWLQDVIDEAKKRAISLAKVSIDFEDNEVTSKSQKYSSSSRENLPRAGQSITNIRTVAIGALKWNELKRDPINDIIFDWNEILNMKGNSGPYLQYTSVRANGILGKVVHPRKATKINFGEKEAPLVRLLVKFPDIVAHSANTYSPSYLCTYLYLLAQNFNRYYDTVKIIGEEEEEMRLNVVKATNTVLTNGLGLLGIEVPEKM